MISKETGASKGNRSGKISISELESDDETEVDIAGCLGPRKRSCSDTACRLVGAYGTLTSELWPSVNEAECSRDR